MRESKAEKYRSTDAGQRFLSHKRALSSALGEPGFSLIRMDVGRPKIRVGPVQADLDVPCEHDQMSGFSTKESLINRKGLMTFGSDFDTLIWPPNDHLNWPPEDKAI
jgi:hypothetical protein